MLTRFVVRLEALVVYRRRVIRFVVARGLERGALSGSVAQAASRGFGLFLSRSLPRPLVVPPRVRVITVGGATLGGSGKTRVALGCARELVRMGARVVLVGHAYRARPRRPRIVRPDDPIAEVGDEALACARELDAPVVVAPSRQAAVDFACGLADLVVIDGPLQIAPVRASLALLAVDADAPWGAGAPPPAGDLRAPREALLAHADHVVAVDARPPTIELERFGLFTAIARPDRLLRGLARRPAVVLSAPDHGPAHRVAREVARWDPFVDGWVATSKCAIHLRELAPRRPIVELPSLARLSDAVLEALGALARKP